MKYMSKMSRNVILPESKKQRKTMREGEGGPGGIMQAKFTPPQARRGKTQISPPRQVKGGFIIMECRVGWHS